jgi:hypothetical protein
MTPGNNEPWKYRTLEITTPGNNDIDPAVGTLAVSGKYNEQFLGRQSAMDLTRILKRR